MSWRQAAERARTRTTELDFFTDRSDLSYLFIDRLNNDVSGDSRITFLHGVGGAGKSLLLSRMEKQLCKRFDAGTWNWLRNAGEEACIQRVIEATDYERVPLTKLDFAPRPNISEDVRDSYQGLMKIRRDLGAAGVRCPLFDFAVTAYLQRSNRLTKEQIEREFPADEVGLALEIAGVLLSPIPFASLVTSVLNVSNRRLGGWFGERQIQRNVDRASIEAILMMDPENELLPALPDMLAEDIVTYLSDPKAPPRIVMLFDTHEAFWERHQGEGAILHEQRDEWLRRLLRGIAGCDRVVAMVAGREVPRWSSAFTFPIAADQLDLHLVGNLSDADARAYLDLRQIHDPAIQQRLIDEARVEEDQVHPFSLGLAADGYHALLTRGGHLDTQEMDLLPGVEHRRRRLIERFLQWVDLDIRDAVMALGLARSFDYKLYAYLGVTVHFPTSRSHFEVITGFSFATLDPEKAGAYRMHDLLRRYLEENGDERTLETVQALEAYFRAEETIERLQVRACIEAIYHRAAYDEPGAVHEFIEVFTQARRAGQYETCRLLIELAGDMELAEPHPATRIHRQLSEYHTFMARYDAALEHIAKALSLIERIESDQSLVHHLRGDLLQIRGEAETGSGNRHVASTTFADAITAYDESLAASPGHPGTLNNKANVLRTLGELHVMRGDQEAATSAFADAIAAYDDSLTTNSGDPGVLNNKANALRTLGELHVSRGDHEAAAPAFADAIAAYDDSLTACPGDRGILGNKGTALLYLGFLHSSLGDGEAAFMALSDAIAIFDASLAARPGDPHTLYNKGIALLSLGNLHVSLGDHDAAASAFTGSITACNACLAARPGDPATLGNKGTALLGLGKLHASRLDHDAAASTFDDAFTAFDASLASRPNHPPTLYNEGTTLLAIGQLRVSRGYLEMAAAAFIDAITVYDESLVYRPDHPATLSNRGLALDLLAHVEQRRKRLEA